MYPSEDLKPSVKLAPKEGADFAVAEASDDPSLSEVNDSADHEAQEQK